MRFCLIGGSCVYTPEQSELIVINSPGRREELSLGQRASGCLLGLIRHEIGDLQWLATENDSLRSQKSATDRCSKLVLSSRYVNKLQNQR